ncbi:Proteasome subunit alpha type-4 [Conglomerata obtusa]
MIIEDPLSKLFLIDPCTNIFMSYCGLSPDALCIRNKAQLICRQYKYDRGEDINIEQLAAGIAGEMQKNTISGGKRPYGVRTLIMGYYNGYRMYVVDPDGNYVEFKKGAIGMKSKEVMDFLVNSNGENECLEGICQVVNNDVGKICLFKIDRNGIERISDEVIKSFVDEFKSKNVQETSN